MQIVVEKYIMNMKKPIFGIPTEPEKEPGYSDEEIDELIALGYIPVANADELNNVRNATLETYGKGTQWEDKYTGGLDKHYVQVLNIDLSKYSEEGWNPIGNDSSSFTGTYDGGNYVIKGLEVKGQDKDYQGLLGYTEGAIIENVALEDINVNGKDSTGGLLGRADSSTTITNSYATGSVKGTGKYTGVLVGSADYYANITNSYWNTETTKQTYSSGGYSSVGREGKTTNEMKEKNTYVDWDFINIWQINEGVSYPTLR